MHTLQQTINPAYLESVSKKQSIFTRFINWTDTQEQFRYGWLGVTLTVHGCFITPATVFVILYSGNNIWLLMTAVTVMTMCLVTNLAAMPTKVIIPVFFTGLLIDLTIIVYSLLQGFSFS